MGNGGGAPPPPFQAAFSQPPAASSLSSADPSSSSSTLTYSASSARGNLTTRGSRGQVPSRGRGGTPSRGGGAAKPFANTSVTFNNSNTVKPSSSALSTQYASQDEENTQRECPPFSSLPPGGSTAFAGTSTSGSSSTSEYVMPVIDAEPLSWSHAQGYPEIPYQTSVGVSPLLADDSTDGLIANVMESDGQGGDENRKIRFARPMGSNRFLDMKAQRPLLRQKYIDQGILPDPEKPQQLSAASRFTGTCMEMCPEFEREEREFQGEGDELEVYTGTTKLDPALAVKIYRRPAAGRELPLPEDVRPPPILKRTLDYLFHSLLPASPNSEQLAHVQGFIWNRTRAVRQDFIVQGQAGPLTIECHERIARWHILSLHWRGGGFDETGVEREWPSDLDPWSEQQELEQLAKTLTSLNEFYDDLRMSTGQSSPNEAEFRAYHLILNLYDPEILRNVELLPEEVFDASILQTAIRLRGYAQRSNRGGTSRANALNTDAPMNFFSRFFAEIKASYQRVPYLLACMLENKFAPIREGGLKALCSNYNKAHRGPSITFVKEALGADTEEQVEHWAELTGIEVEKEGDGESFLKLSKQVELTKSLPQSFSLLVESKRGKYNSRQIIDGVASGAAPLLANTAPSSAQPLSKARPSSLTSIPSAASNARPPVLTQPDFIPSGSKPTFGCHIADQPQAQPSAFASMPSFGTLGGAFGTSISGATPGESLVGKPALSSKSIMTPTASPFQLSQPPKSDVGSTPTSSGFPVPDAKTRNEGKALSVAPFVSTLSAAFTLASTPQPVESEAKPSESIPQLSSPIAGTTVQASLPKLGEKSPQLSAPLVQTSPPSAAKDEERKRSKAIQRVFSELVTEKGTSLARETLEEEKRRRRSIARQAFLTLMNKRLLEALQQDVIIKISGDTSGGALADESRRRTIANSYLTRWRLTLQRREERAQQKARLTDVRAQILEKGLLHQPLSSSKGGLRRALMLPDFSVSPTGTSSPRIALHSSALKRSRSSIEEDDQLRASYSQSKAERSHLWEQGTFFTYIASHMAALFSRWRPVEMEFWSVLLSLPDDSSSSAWLEQKFGLSSEQPRREIPVAIDVKIRGELVANPAEIRHQDTGLLVFVLSADLAAPDLSDEDQTDVWNLEAKRLKALEESEALSRSRFSPRLLVIHWAKGSRMEDVLIRLDLDANAERSFKDVAVCNLGDSSEPDETFNLGISNLLQDISVRSRQAWLRLTDLILPLRRPWSSAAATVEELLGRLRTEGTSATGPAIEVFVAMLALANHVLNSMVQISEADCSKDILLPQPTVTSLLEKLGSLPPSQALAHASKQVIDESEEMGEGQTLSLSRALILQQEQQKSKRFPLAMILENLLQSKLNLLAEIWASHPANREMIMQSLAENTRYVQEAAGSIVTFAAEKVRADHEQQTKLLRRRKEEEAEGEEKREESERQQTANFNVANSGRAMKRSARSSTDSSSPLTPSKRSRSITTIATTGSPTISTFVGTNDIQRLKGLIASAKGLLTGPTV